MGQVQDYREFVKRKIKMAELKGVPCEKVDRLIERYSNKGELIYDPFGGLMTVPYRAILLGRNGGASELCESYFDDGVKYLRMAEADRNVPSLFDELEDEETKGAV